MKFSEAWLRDWVDPDIDRQTLLDQLTMAGLEVEVVEAVAPPLPDVVVARIEACDPHSDGGHLSICQVADGTGNRQVVCGAPNARAGVLTALALPGSELPGGITVEAAQIRGVASAGMLCSAAELGLGDDAAGILELDDGTCGTALAEVLALDDVSIEIKLTPNRGDCLSLRGLAREIGVLNGLPVRHQDATPPPAQSETVFPVTLADPAGCPRYLGRVIEGIDLSAQAPLWMKERLRRCGLRSINAVVDVTNYVMLELGQPMHAFDLSVLSKRIIVRRADLGETLKMLDGRPISLGSQDLVIADEAGPVAIAGVMGGERSGVQATTEDVFLECAWFDPLTVAETARRFGLHTDASHRYERGVDHQLQQQAMERATALLLAIAGGRAGPTEEALVAEHLPDTAVVSLRQRRLHQLAGVAMDADQVDAALARLDFQLRDRRETDDDGVVWTIAAPSHRFDIGIEADLVEEVCRIHGYDNIPSQTPNAALRPRPKPLEQSGERQLKAELAALGFQEVITYSFVDPDRQALLDPGTQALALANPMSADQSVMRTNLLPGLVESLRFNQNRQQRRAQLFELGLCFRAAEEPGQPVDQVRLLGGLMWGEQVPESWHGKPVAADFFDLKGAVERLLEWTGTKALKFAPSDDPVLHPGQQAGIHSEGQPIGRIGRLHPRIENELELASGVLVFEIEGDAALAHPLRRFTEIPSTPRARRDLALLVDESVTADNVRETLSNALGTALRELTLFDVYRSKNIDSNKKSLAVGLTFQGASSTLTDQDIAVWMSSAIEALQSKLGAQLR